MLIRLLFLYFLISFSAFSKNYIKPYAGCIDCFNFVAPTILGAENISPAEVGLIVYDSYFNSFRAYNSAGSWSKLSNEQSIRTVSSSANAYSTDDIVTVNAASGSITITLPTASTTPGKVLIVKKIDTSSNSVIVDGASTETIDGVANKSLYVKNDMIKIVSDGSNWLDITEKIARPPTVQKFLSGSGTYNTPNGVVYIRVKMIGGGGGGAGSGTSSQVAGGSGAASTFGSSLLVANGGSGGQVGAGGYIGGGGGTASLGSGPIGTAVIGASGEGASVNATTFIAGGSGGSGVLGGAGQSLPNGGGGAGSANTGGGATGGGTTSVGGCWNGAGGGSGGYVDAIINSPASSYSFSVGSGGGGGSAGANGYAGGTGGTGVIIVEEFYK